MYEPFLDIQLVKQVVIDDNLRVVLAESLI